MRKIYAPKLLTKTRIETENSLEDMLSIPRGTIGKLSNLPPDKKFRRLIKLKSDGSERVVHCPHWQIRVIMRRINKRLFSNPKRVEWPFFIYGCIKKSNLSTTAKDYIECAQQHSKSKTTMKLDIHNFFSSISESRTTEVLENILGLAKPLSKTISKMNCVDGHLVQGSPISSYVAAAIFGNHEGFIVRKLERRGITYTRYVDDITISSKRKMESFIYALSGISKMLESKELELNSNKTKIMNQGLHPMIVHGIEIKNSKIKLTDDEMQSIRQSVFSLAIYYRSKLFRESTNYRAMHDKCTGRVGKLRRIDPDKYNKLTLKLNSIPPESSKSDLEMCEKWTSAAKEKYASKKNHYHHIRAIRRTLHRVYKLKQKFPMESDRLKKILLPIAKDYGSIQI